MRHTGGIPEKKCEYVICYHYVLLFMITHAFSQLGWSFAHAAGFGCLTTSPGLKVNDGLWKLKTFAVNRT